MAKEAHIPYTSQDDMELHRLLLLQGQRLKQNKIFTFYPDKGELRRELYVPHMRFFEAGGEGEESLGFYNANIRAILAGNRVGKTEGIGGYELTLHLTGLYPEWWKGKRFNRPIKGWAAGKTGLKTRDIAQAKLLGGLDGLGTGLIPKDHIDEKSIRSKAGVPNAIESVRIKNVYGGFSLLVFKSYAEGRDGFEGEEVDVIWLDEEPPMNVFSECLIRIMPTIPGEPPGHILATFTPLDGISDVVLHFLPEGKLPPGSIGTCTDNRFVVMASWQDAPHLTKQQQEEMLREIPLYQREARSKGIPQLGSGAIYPIEEDYVTVEDFRVPEYWPRIYGFDVGWNWTAASWMAHDKQSDVVYIYSCYIRSQKEPAVHVQAINARGNWIPGAIDPASSGSSQLDGRKLLNEYLGLGLNIFKADNAREAGILAVWNRLSNGGLKVFKSCLPWFGEFRMYRRDEKGNIVKQNDHLMDTTRYGIMSLPLAMEQPDPDFEDFDSMEGAQHHDTTAGWY